MKQQSTLPAKSRGFEFATIVGVCAIGLVLALAVFILLQRYFSTIERERFERDATYWSTAFTSAIERHVNSLAALRAFVSASRDDVSRWAFSSFAEETLAAHPGFPAFFWVPSIAGKDRALYEADLQRDGLFGLKIRELGADGHLVPAGARPVYHPLSYVAPFDGHAPVGLDLGLAPEFRALFDQAEKTGQVAVSEPLFDTILDDETGPQVIVAFPLLKPGSNKTQGVALGVLKFERILKLVASQGARIEIAIAYNEPAFARKLIYSSVGNPAASRGIKDWARQSDYSRETEFDVAGRHFVLGLRAPPSATSWMGFLEPLGAALLVIALAALLAQHLYATIVARQAVERAVVLRTRQLQNANAALEEEIRSRREVEADLRAAKEKAEGANSAKSEFLATMSHELRTPLNAIIGFSSMLAQTPADQRSQEACVDYITQIHEGGIRLLGLINDLLDLTQMDSGRLRLDEDIVPVEDLIDTAVAKMGARAEAASVRLSARVQDGLLPLRADERRLLKALTALLSNAIKFSPRGGSAEITARRSADGGLCVEVRDMGVGIPKGQERRILEPFIQLDSTLARSHEGAGLGLTFVKRVAELHDATLSIASDLGKGTCVTLSFPASRVVKTAEVA